MPRLHLFKVVYEEAQHYAWAHWNLNDNGTRVSVPISCAELLKRTGIEFLPGIRLDD